MASGQLTTVLEHIRRLVTDPSGPRLADGALLDRFVHYQEESAFAALVERHSKLVMGVCRRVLQHTQDAEDAFQATFLVLARKAGSIRKRASVGSWLYGVAYHLAVQARAQARRRRTHEREAHFMPQPASPAQAVWPQLQPVLDEELHQLPEKYRQPLVLCYLQGKSNREAAAELGWPVGSISRRLTRGRELLRQSLTRRGIRLTSAALTAVLSEKMATAGVPLTLLDTTVKAALRFAAGKKVAGLVSAHAVQLARGILKTMAVTKLKIATVFLLALTLVGLGSLVRPAAAHKAAEAGPAPRANTGKTASGASGGKERARPDSSPKLVVTGQVRDAAGRPAAGARVAVFGYQATRLSVWENYASESNEVLGQAQTDAAGRFRLAVPRLGAVTVRQVRVVAGHSGHGLAWRRVDPDARETNLELRLPAEQSVRGQLLDLQGSRLAGIKVEVARVDWKEHGKEPWDSLSLPSGDPACWPKPAVTDEQGRFTFKGLGQGYMVHLRARARRVVFTDKPVNTGNRAQAENVRIVLAPAHHLEGRVVAEDTRKPLANVRVNVNAYSTSEIQNDYVIREWGNSSGRTDAQGRFKLTFIPGNRVSLEVRPADGGLYLSVHQSFPWPREVVQKQTEVVLPRGCVVRGKITEAATGKGVAGAFVEFHAPQVKDPRFKSILSGWNARVTAGADGAYRMAVPPGANRLVVQGPTPDYVPQVVGSAELEIGKAGGDPVYCAAVIPLDVKPADKEKDVNVPIRRGVTIRGRLVGPDGKPVLKAAMFSSSHPLPYEKFLTGHDITDGRFELRGCDPRKKYRLLFVAHNRPLRITLMAEGVGSNGRLWLPELLDPQNRLGASVTLSAGKDAEPVVVRLAACGAVKFRIVDAQGRPMPNIPWLKLIVSPGPSFTQALKRGVLAGEEVSVNAPFGGPNRMPRSTDKDGHITIGSLIPGATYQLFAYNRMPLKDFQVEAGKTLELPDIVMK